jgi:AcrR family transcriptional regulator
MEPEPAMTPPRKTTTKGERRREQIRVAAYRCFRDTGYHDTSVDAICEKAGISKGSLYWHYTSKQEIFVDILETWSREITDEMFEQFERAVLDDDYVGAVTRALHREMQRGRLIVPLWLEFNLQARREPEIRNALAKFYRRARTAIAEMLRPVAAGRLDEDELNGVAEMIFGAYAGLMMQDLSDPEDASGEHAATSFMRVLGRWLGLFSNMIEQLPVETETKSQQA